LGEQSEAIFAPPRPNAEQNAKARREHNEQINNKKHQTKLHAPRDLILFVCSDLINSALLYLIVNCNSQRPSRWTRVVAMGAFGNFQKGERNDPNPHSSPG
jgi:hypothetical protein